MKEIYLIGGGGHCQSCIDVIESQGKYKIAGILDLPENVEKSLYNYSIIGTEDEITRLAGSGAEFLVTVGQIKSSETRMRIFNRLTESGATLATVISPRAYVSKRASLGAGTIVMHDALINSGAVIGRNCIINTKALIEHGAVVGDHSHVATASVVNGDVRLGSGCFVGSNAVIRQSLVLPDKTFVNAGEFYNGK